MEEKKIQLSDWKVAMMREDSSLTSATSFFIKKKKKIRSTGKTFPEPISIRPGGKLMKDVYVIR